MLGISPKLKNELKNLARIGDIICEQRSSIIMGISLALIICILYNAYYIIIDMNIRNQYGITSVFYITKFYLKHLMKLSNQS